MTPAKAIEFMEKTGKPVRVVNSNSLGYYKLFRNDMICKLIPNTSCTAIVQSRFTVEEFISEGKYFRFEEHILQH